MKVAMLEYVLEYWIMYILSMSLLQGRFCVSDFHRGFCISIVAVVCSSAAPWQYWTETHWGNLRCRRE